MKGAYIRAINWHMFIVFQIIKFCIFRRRSDISGKGRVIRQNK